MGVGGGGPGHRGCLEGWPGAQHGHTRRTPSTDRTVRFGCNSVATRTDRASASPPARVASAYWWVAVAVWNWGLNCCASVRATRRRNTSPMTSPADPAIGFLEGDHASEAEGEEDVGWEGRCGEAGGCSGKFEGGFRPSLEPLASVRWSSRRGLVQRRGGLCASWRGGEQCQGAGDPRASPFASRGRWGLGVVGGGGQGGEVRPGWLA